MQDVTPLIKEGKKRIEKYADNYLVVNNQQYSRPVFITPDYIVSLEGILNITSVSLELLDKHIKAASANGSEVNILLVGGGYKTEFLSATIEKSLKQKQIVADYCDSGAACRTYNILLTEERNVAAIII